MLNKILKLQVMFQHNLLPCFAGRFLLTFQSGTNLLISILSNSSPCVIQYLSKDQVAGSTVYPLWGKPPNSEQENSLPLIHINVVLYSQSRCLISTCSLGWKIVHRKSRLRGEEPPEIQRVEATDTNTTPCYTSRFLKIFLELRVAGRHSVTWSLSESAGAILRHRSYSRDLSAQAPAAMGCFAPCKSKD